LGYWKKSPSSAGGTAGPAIDRNLVFPESLPCVSGDDSEEDGGKPIEKHASDGDAGGDIGHPIVPVVVAERAKSQKIHGRTVGVNEMKGLVSDLGKAWERSSGEPSGLEGSESREVVTDFVGMVEAGPSSVQEAMESKEKSKWKAAMVEEISNLERLKT